MTEIMHKPKAPQIVIVYGPHASGKTRNSEAIKERFELKRVVDGWEEGDPLSKGDLALTIQMPSPTPPNAVCISIETALRILKI